MSGIMLMRAGLARMAAGVRGAVGIAAVASALLGIERPVSWWWLGPVIAAVICWTAFYAIRAWTRGLGRLLICVDLLLIAMLCLALGKLLPPQAIPGASNWISNVASMAVVSAQLSGFLDMSIPGGLVVAAGYVAGSRLAHAADGGLNGGLILVGQTLLAAAVMAVAMRAERGAVRVFAELEREQEAAQVAAARREEERLQQGVIHNGPLTVLAMALHADDEQASITLRQRAAQTRARLLEFAAETRSDRSAARLDEHLAQPVLWYQAALKITAVLPACTVPAGVADAFAEAAAEALENIVRHARTSQARVELREDGGRVQVRVADTGSGFDATRAPAYGFGLRKGLPGRMAAAGGSATVTSAPGRGTVVLLEWPRG